MNIGGKRHKLSNVKHYEVPSVYDDAEGDVGQLWRRLEQGPVLQGTSADLDEDVFGDEAQTFSRSSSPPWRVGRRVAPGPRNYLTLP